METYYSREALILLYSLCAPTLGNPQEQHLGPSGHKALPAILTPVEALSPPAGLLTSKMPPDTQSCLKPCSRSYNQ